MPATAPERIPDSLVLATAKGGVGKTTISANLAAVAASKGRRVVAVDLDAQGNLAMEFGVPDHDQGAGLRDAALGGGAPLLHPTRRKGLWLIPAGAATVDLEDAAAADDLAVMLASALAQVCDGAMVVIDTAPSAVSPLADAALRLARWLLIPTRCDRKSVAGIPTMLTRVLEMPRPRVAPVGVVLFDVPARATRIAAGTRRQLNEDLAGAFPVLESTIRSAVKAQRDASGAGIVAAEYAAIAAGKSSAGAVSFALNASALAEDYRQLSDEIDLLTT